MQALLRAETFFIRALLLYLRHVLGEPLGINTIIRKQETYESNKKPPPPQVNFFEVQHIFIKIPCNDSSHDTP